MVFFDQGQPDEPVLKMDIGAAFLATHYFEYRGKPRREIYEQGTGKDL
jgi:hypothetical protein